MMYSSHECHGDSESNDDNNKSGSSSSEGVQQPEKEETMYMFILEGSRVLPWSKEPATRRGALPCSTVHAALVKTQLRDGFPVLHSSGRDGTVALVQYLFDELCKGGLDLKPSVRKVFLFLLFLRVLLKCLFHAFSYASKLQINVKKNQLNKLLFNAP